MVFKFTELFETKYIYLTFHKDVNYVLNKCAALQKDPNVPCHPLNETCRKLFDCAKSAAPIEFDLAEAVITSDITPCITDFIRKGFVFKDSSNVYRNSILQENARRAKISTENYISLPTFNLNMKVSDWIKSLPADEVIKPSAQNTDLYIPLVVMATLLRHKLNFCLDDIQKQYFTFIANRLSVSSLKLFDEFFVYVPDEGVYVQQFNPTGYVQSLGLVGIEEAATAAYLVPTAITKKRALDIDKEFDTDIFTNIFNECHRIVQGFIANRKVHLDDVL